MAREYGKLMVRIWGDPDYRSLPGAAQHLYMQLISQPDMSMAGVLTTAPARWAGQTEDYTPESVAAALEVLEARRFTVSDPATMETLVRTYIRNDMGWRSPKTMTGIDSSIRTVLSPMLKSTIAVELGRCDTATLSETVSATTGRSTRAVVEGLIGALRVDFPDSGKAPLTVNLGDLPGSVPDQQERVADRVSDTPSDRVSRVSLTETEPEPEPETETEPSAASGDVALFVDPPAPARTPRKRAGVYPDDFEAWWIEYPRKDDKVKALPAWRRAVAEVGNAALIDGAIAYREDPNRLDEYTKYPASWLNAGAWANGPLPARGGGRPSNLDQTLDVVAQMHAARAARQNTQQIAPPAQTPRRIA